MKIKKIYLLGLIATSPVLIVISTVAVSCAKNSASSPNNEDDLQPKPVEQPKQEGKPNPVETPNPVEQPKPEVKPKPVEAPKPLEHPKPEVKPKPIETIKPVEKPKPDISDPPKPETKPNDKKDDPKKDIGTPNTGGSENSKTQNSGNEFKENNVYNVYDKFSDLINENYNFINKNFKAQNLGNGIYKKNYRLHQMFKNAVWKFDANKNKFTWSVDEQWIKNMLERDSKVSNVKLYLFVETINPETKEVEDYLMQKSFKDYLDQDANKQMIQERYAKGNFYPLGIEIKWESLKELKSILIKTEKWFDLKVNYNAVTKDIEFEIIGKEGVKLTDEPYLATIKKEYVFLSSLSNFLSLSFETNNNENKTFKPFEIPSKAEEGGVNVNAFDISTRVENSNENRYIDYGKVNSKRNLPELEQEMLTRSFTALGGSWTIFQKVLPSDKNDNRYFAFTNQHISRATKNDFDPNKVVSYSLEKFVNYGSDVSEKVLLSSQKDLNKPFITTFWGFDEYKNRWTDEIFYNPKRDAPMRDFQVSIVHLDNILWEINDKIKKEKDTKELGKLKALKEDLEKWPTLQNLEFTDRYKVIGNSSDFLDDIIITGYPKGFPTSSTARKIRAEDFGNKIWYKGENSWIMNRGGSGALIVSRDRKIVGIHANSVGGDNWRQGQLFYSSIWDNIGSNVDGSNPSKNNNPSTLSKAIIEANQKYPLLFELLDFVKDKN